MAARPYLSIVAATRNDNHGGDLSRRSEVFIRGVVAQAVRYHLPTELILVEWNPPDARPRLAEEFDWPTPNPWCEIRIVTVPGSIHRRYRYADKLPMFQMIAKNVGVRRARGEFVLATNIDILFSDALFAHLATRKLEKGVLYRCDRVDADRNVPLGVPFEEQLEYCRTNVLRVAKRDGMWIVPPGATLRTVEKAVPALSRDDQGAAALNIRMKLVRSQFRRLRRLVQMRRESVEPGGPKPGQVWFDIADWLLVIISSMFLVVARLAFSPLLFLWRLLLAYPLAPARQLWLVDVPAAYSRLKDLGFQPTLRELLDEAEARQFRMPSIHSHACGDFILMDAASWEAIRGSPELPIFSLHLDSLTLVTAIKAGIRVSELPAEMVIFHIEHGSGWTPEQNDDLYRRINKLGIAILSDRTYLRYAENLLASRDFFLSSPRWGLVDETLEETTVTERVPEGTLGVPIEAL